MGQVTELQAKDIPEIISIHSKELSGFLVTLGDDFLRLFYEVSLSVAGLKTIVFRKEGKIAGFSTVTASTKGLYLRIVRTELSAFSLLFLKLLLRSPKKFIFLLMALTYSGFSVQGAELLSLAVAAPYQRQGIGKILFRESSKKVQEMGKKQFKISAYASNANAYHFYTSMGCTVVGAFPFMNKKMVYYEYNIE